MCSAQLASQRRYTPYQTTAFPRCCSAHCRAQEAHPTNTLTGGGELRLGERSAVIGGFSGRYGMRSTTWLRLASIPGGRSLGSGPGRACIGAAGRSRQHSIDGAVSHTLSMDVCTAWLAKQHVPGVHPYGSRGRSRALARRSTGCAGPATVPMHMCPRKVLTPASRRSTHPSLPRAFTNAGGCTVLTRALTLHLRDACCCLCACVFIGRHMQSCPVRRLFATPLCNGSCYW